MGICESKMENDFANQRIASPTSHVKYNDIKTSIESLEGVTKAPDPKESTEEFMSRTGSYSQAMTTKPKFNASGELVTAKIVYDYPEASELSKFKTIFVLGRPGSGKTTQALYLHERFGFAVLSLKHLVQKELKLRSKTGLRGAKEFHDGKLSPELAVYLITKAMMEPSNQKRTLGVIFEDFPQTVEEAQFLEGVGVVPSVIFELDCSAETCALHLSGANQALLTPEFSKRQSRYVSSDKIFATEYNTRIHTVMGESTEEDTFSQMTTVVEANVVPAAKETNSKIDIHVFHIDVGLKPGEYLGVSLYCDVNETAVRLTAIETDGALANYKHLISDGDVLISVNGKDVSDDFDAAEYALLSLKSEEPVEVKLTLLRNDKYKPPSRSASPNKKILQFTPKKSSGVSLVSRSSIPMPSLDEELQTTQPNDNTTTTTTTATTDTNTDTNTFLSAWKNEPTTTNNNNDDNTNNNTTTNNTGEDEEAIDLATPTNNENKDEFGLEGNQVDEGDDIKALQEHLICCVEYLMEEKHIKEEGLFRTCGSQEQVLNLYDLMMNGQTYDLDSILDPAVVTGVLKKIMKTEGYPLNTDLTKDLFSATDDQKSILVALHELSPQRRVAVVELKSLLKKVAETEDNLMSLEALAIAFGPTFLPGLGQTDAKAMLQCLITAFEPTIRSPSKQ